MGGAGNRGSGKSLIDSAANKILPFARACLDCATTFQIMDINCFNVILAQAATPPAGQPQGSPFGLLVPMILVFVIMYFMMIRPQQKRAKQQAEMLKTLKSGDRVVTASGILERSFQ